MKEILLFTTNIRDGEEAEMMVVGRGRDPGLACPDINHQIRAAWYHHEFENLGHTFMLRDTTQSVVISSNS